MRVEYKPPEGQEADQCDSPASLPIADKIIESLRLGEEISLEDLVEFKVALTIQKVGRQLCEG